MCFSVETFCGFRLPVGIPDRFGPITDWECQQSASQTPDSCFVFFAVLPKRTFLEILKETLMCLWTNSRWHQRNRNRALAERRKRDQTLVWGLAECFLTRAFDGQILLALYSLRCMGIIEITAHNQPDPILVGTMHLFGGWVSDFTCWREHQHLISSTICVHFIGFSTYVTENYRPSVDSSGCIPLGSDLRHKCLEVCGLAASDDNSSRYINVDGMFVWQLASASVVFAQSFANNFKCFFLRLPVRSSCSRDKISVHFHEDMQCFMEHNNQQSDHIESVPRSAQSAKCFQASKFWWMGVQCAYPRRRWAHSCQMMWLLGPTRLTTEALLLFGAGNARNASAREDRARGRHHCHRGVRLDPHEPQSSLTAHQKHRQRPHTHHRKVSIQCVQIESKSPCPGFDATISWTILLVWSGAFANFVSTRKPFAKQQEIGLEKAQDISSCGSLHLFFFGSLSVKPIALQANCHRRATQPSYKLIHSLQRNVQVSPTERASQVFAGYRLWTDAWIWTRWIHQVKDFSPTPGFMYTGLDCERWQWFCSGAHNLSCEKHWIHSATFCSARNLESFS